MESKTGSVNGIRMRWEEHGEGEPVVFIHGIPTSLRLWRRVIPHVRGVRALAWEMVGYGASIEYIDVPARVVWVAADRFQKIGYGYRLAHELGASLDRIEEGKHFVPEDHPEVVSAAVDALLDRGIDLEPPMVRL